MWTVTWALKVSKQCNLRCRYCYEWNDLARPDRWTGDNWIAALRAIDRVHRRHEARSGHRGRSYVVWHGGEPLLLPVRYAREVLAAQQDLLGTGRLHERDYVNVVQTGLYSLDDGWLDLLAENGFEAGVSFDLVPGVRLTAGGRETERRVIGNLERLIARGVPVIGAVVLARHTEHELGRIHDFFAQRGLPFQVNLLVPSPALPPGNRLELEWSRAAAALEGLFLHWVAAGSMVEIQPLAGYLATVLLHRLGLERETAPADRWSGRLVVDTSGDMYRGGDLGMRERGLGNLFTDPLESLLGVDDGSASRSDAARRERHCTTCTWRPACDGSPVLASPRPFERGTCPVAARVMAFIDRHLDGWGYDEMGIIQNRFPVRAGTAGREMTGGVLSIQGGGDEPSDCAVGAEGWRPAGRDVRRYRGRAQGGAGGRRRL